MSRGVPSFYPKTEPADKTVGSAWRFVGTHNDNRERHGQPCTIYQHNGVGGYPYAVRFADGCLMNAVNRELEPIEDGAA